MKQVQKEDEGPARQEAVLMDFSNTFKAGTRGFKKKTVKKAV